MPDIYHTDGICLYALILILSQWQSTTPILFQILILIPCLVNSRVRFVCVVRVSPVCILVLVAITVHLLP